MGIFKAGKHGGRGGRRREGTNCRSEERAQSSGLDLSHVKYLGCE